MFRLLFICLFCGWLSACHPSYTAQQTELIARKIGVIDQLEIERWNNRVLSQRASLAVAVAAIKPLQISYEEMTLLEPAEDEPDEPFETVMHHEQVIMDSSALLALANRAMNSTFSQVSQIEGEHSLASARQQASYLGVGFLLHFAAEPIAEVGSRRQRWRVNVTIMDANSGAVVDKAAIWVASARLPFSRGEELELLQQPLQLLAADLSGLPH